MTPRPVPKPVLGWATAVAVVYALPYVVLGIAGAVWLYERRWWWVWLAGTAALSGAAWAVFRWVRGKKPQPRGVVPDPRWSPAGQAAWADVEQIAQRVERQGLPLDHPETLGTLLVEIFQAVAARFHPGAAQPHLETAVPDVLYIVERVARDLREFFSENVPGAHIFTLSDFRRLQAWAGAAQHLYGIYRTLLRVVRLGTNPLWAAVAEVRDAAMANMCHASVDQIKRQVAGRCVRRAGFYAIQLYSGQLVDDEALKERQSARSREDIEKAIAVQDRIAKEPLRILVLGQLKAGKSSLINALAGQLQAAVDVLPCTGGVQPVRLVRQGICLAIALDTPGFDAAPGSPSPFAAIREELPQSDLVVLVVPASSASRTPERRLLDDMRAYYQADPRRVMPALVVAVSHIDCLRPFAEWAPPYDLAEPTGAKAENIRRALQAIAEDLGLTPQQPMVPVCLRPDRLYNVQEGLLGALEQVRKEAERAQYHRLLGEIQREGGRGQLGRQIKKALTGLFRLVAAKALNR